MQKEAVFENDSEMPLSTLAQSSFEIDGDNAKKLFCCQVKVVKSKNLFWRTWTQHPLD